MRLADVGYDTEKIEEAIDEHDWLTLYRTHEFNHGQSRLLLATDASSEGIDLQHSCHIMVNYELPWNPNRLEQRIGRIHRYGQDKEVKVWNFQFDGTREAEIFELLEEKVENIRSKVGSTADVLGMLDDVNIDDLLMRSVRNNEPPVATAEEFESLVEEREQTLLQWYERSLIDPSTFDEESRQRLREVMDESAEVFGSEADIRQFVRDGLAVFSGDIRKTGDHLYELSVPDHLSNTGQLTTRGPITFNHEFAMDHGGIEYLSPDDRLVQRLRNSILGDRSEEHVGLKLLSFIDEPGIVFVLRVGFEDGTSELIHEELVPIFIDQANRNPRRPLAETVLERETVAAMPDGTTVRQLLEERETLEEAAEGYVGNVITGIHSDLRETR